MDRVLKGFKSWMECSTSVILSCYIDMLSGDYKIDEIDFIAIEALIALGED